MKLRWAREHHQRLRARFQEFISGATAPYIELAFDPQRAAHIVKCHMPAPLPTEWSLVVGDVVHNARSALDALTYELAEKNLGREPSEKEAKATQFVITDDEASWDDQRKRWLKFVSEGARETMHSLQPFHPIPKTGNPSPVLSILRDLSNVDKHRHLNVVAGFGDNYKVTLAGPGYGPDSVGTWRGELRDGLEIAALRFMADDEAGTPLPEIPADTKVDLVMDMIVMIGAGPNHGVNVDAALFSILWYIENDVFPRLEEHL